MKHTALFLAAACLPLVVACSGGEGEDAGDETTESLSASLPQNKDIDSVVVWSQNIKMGLDRVRDIVRCMGDSACNGLKAVPDIILLQEASCDNVKQIESLLKRPAANGGVGVAGWGRICVENPGSGGVTGHWLSNAILYRSDRFRVESASNVRALPSMSFKNGACTKAGIEIPVARLLDIPRAKAGRSAHRVVLGVRHDDNFAEGMKTTCDNQPGGDDHFCSLQNSRLIDAAMNDLDAGLKIMAGDWNYAAKACSGNQSPTTHFRRDYACTTRQAAADCSKTNLGWNDPILAANPAAYDTSTSIDFIHVKSGGRVDLNKTAKNARPGVVDKHFYNAGEATAMSDHDGRLMRIFY